MQPGHSARDNPSSRVLHRAIADSSLRRATTSDRTVWLPFSSAVGNRMNYKLFKSCGCCSRCTADESLHRSGSAGAAAIPVQSAGLPTSEALLARSTRPGRPGRSGSRVLRQSRPPPNSPRSCGARRSTGWQRPAARGASGVGGRRCARRQPGGDHGCRTNALVGMGALRPGA